MYYIMDRKLLIIFFLINLVNLIAGYVFPNITNMGNFHTKVDYRSNTNHKSAYVEEFFNFATGRGRLDVMTNGTLKTYLYDYRTQQILEFANNKCTVYNDLKQSLSQLFTNKFYRWTDAYDATKLPMIGPTALIRQVMRGINNGSLTSVSSPTLTSIRGIPCQTFTVTGNTFNANRLTFYFADPSWNKFEFLNMFKRIPVRVTVAGTNPDGSALNVDIDYFLFEVYSNTWDDFLPPMGIGCKGKKSIKNLPTISNKFKTSIEVFDMYTQRITGVQQYINRINVVYDGYLNLVKVDGFNPLIEDSFKIIMDFNRGISYVFGTDQACQIRHIQNSPLLRDQNSIGYLKAAQDLLGWKNDTYYLGKTYARGIFCDVWERVAYNSPIANTQYNVTFAKVVYTYYILDSGSKDVTNDVLGTDTPIQTIMTGYSVDGKDPTFKVELNFFSFAETLYNDDDVVGVFDVRNCFTESDMRRYVELYIPAQKTNAPIAQKYFKQFRQALVQEISYAAQISPLRIPFLELDFGENAIMANVMILDKESASLSFKKLIPNSRPSANLKKISVLSDDECARKTLAQKGKGFFYCQDKSCYIKTDAVINKNPATASQNCTLYMLDAVNASVDFLAASANLTTALTNLKTAVNKNQCSFSVFLDNTDGGGQVTYRVQNMMISDQIVVDIYGNSLYNMSIAGFVLDSKLPSTKVLTSSATSSVGDCYRGCKSDTGIRCTSFSFCRDIGGSARCLISSKLVYEEMPNRNTQVQVDSACSTYVMSYLNGYTKVDGQVILSSGDQNTKTTNANLCAKECTFNKKLPCKSFQYCQTGECFLRSQHTLEFGSVKSKSNSQLTGCAFYSVKYLADYVTTGFTIINDPKALKFKGDSAEVCAQHCSSQTDNCTSFNYCPPDTASSNLWSTCELSSKSIYTAGVKTTAQKFCRHYERNYWSSNAPAASSTKGGMSSGNFFGLIFGLFITGAILGVFGYIGYQYYTKEMKNKGSSGISVRFMRQDGDKATVQS